MFRPQVSNMNGSPAGQPAQQQASNDPGNIDLSLMPPDVRAFVQESHPDEVHLTQQERQDRDTARLIQAQQDSVNYETAGRLPYDWNTTNHTADDSSPMQSVATVIRSLSSAADPVFALEVHADLARLRERARTKALARKKRDALDSDFDDSDVETTSGSRKRKAIDTSDASEEGESGRTKGSKTKKNKVAHPPRDLSIDDVLGAGSTVYEKAAATAHLHDQPTTNSSRSTAKALASLLHSMPAIDRKVARDDKAKLADAIAGINDGVRSVMATGVAGESGWMLRGMKTSLKHYQIEALAFLRRQERKDEDPKGGILADSMGLGKTVEMLSNIVKGIQEYREDYKVAKRIRFEAGKKSKPPAPPRPTLIVVPASLLHQWSNEIRKHAHVIEAHEKKKDAENEAVNWGIHGVLDYRDLKHLKKPEQKMKEIHKHDIVLVTYKAVLASHPSDNEPAPIELTEAGKKKWHKRMRDNAAGALHRVKWQRVVLDEAHIIKNHLSATSIACRTLKANHYWAMSGTPVQNSLSEFYPYLKLIREPLAQSIRSFNKNFCDADNELCTPRLLALLSSCYLRRTMSTTMFGRKLLPLQAPHAPRTFRVDLNPTERYIYQTVEAFYRSEVEALRKVSVPPVKVYAQIWVKMLRLRQTLGHFILLHDVMAKVLTQGALEKLCEQIPKDEASAEAEQMKLALTLMARDKLTNPNTEEHDVIQPIASLDELRELVPDAKEGVFGELNVDYAKYFKEFTTGKVYHSIKKQTTCVLCRSMPNDAHMTDCGHMYCYDCLDDLLRRAARTGRPAAKCHSCRAEFNGAKKCIEPTLDEDSLSVSPEPEGLSEMDHRMEVADKARGKTLMKWLREIKGAVAPSTKTMAMKSICQEFLAQDPNVKIIVYSQFVRLLKILQNVCECEGWDYRHYNGSMDLDARANSLKAFSNEGGSVRILLASLQCGSVGLNLTAASHVVLMDSWFNDSVEEQAFCRVFRQGQTKKTSLTRIVVNNSIDTYLEDMKARKSEAINTVLTKDGQIKVKPSISEMITLFGPNKSDIGENGFVDGSEDEFEDAEEEVLPHHDNDRDNEYRMDEDA